MRTHAHTHAHTQIRRRTYTHRHTHTHTHTLSHTHKHTYANTLTHRYINRQALTIITCYCVLVAWKKVVRPPPPTPLDKICINLVYVLFAYTHASRHTHTQQTDDGEDDKKVQFLSVTNNINLKTSPLYSFSA